MTTVLQLLVNCLQIGAVYILFSVGLTLVFGVMRIVNFAHGQFFTISALIVAEAVPRLAGLGVPPVASYLLSAVMGIAVSLVLGFIVYTWGLRYFQRDMVGSFILTVGLALVIDGVLLQMVGGTARPVPEIFGGAISFFGVRLAVQGIVVIVAAIVVTLALYWSMTRTRLGKALRAVAADHEAAMLQGIPHNRLVLIGFLIATGLAAVAGALIAPMTAVSTTIGADYLVKGFIAVIIGGLGSTIGAIVGALFIASIEAVGGYYFDASSSTLAMFVLVIVVLLFMPKGVLRRG